MCMGASAGPSKAVVAQEAENARLAEERLNEKRAALQNPFDLIPDEVKKNEVRFQGKRGLKIALNSQSQSGGTGLSIKG